MFTVQKVRDLLAAALLVTNPYLPDQPLHRRGNLPSSAEALLGLPMTVEKTREPGRGNPFEPEPDRLSVSSQMARNLRMAQALDDQLSGQRDLGECLHVHRPLWTIGYLRQHCGHRNVGILKLCQNELNSARKSLGSPVQTLSDL